MRAPGTSSGSCASPPEPEEPRAGRRLVGELHASPPAVPDEPSDRAPAAPPVPAALVDAVARFREHGAGARDEAGDEARDIVGRDPELAELAEFLDADSPWQALVLHGAAGIGKTTLWEAGVAAARGRFRILEARPASAEIQLSFAALGDLVEGVADDELAALPAPQRQALEIALLRAEPTSGPPEPRAIALGLLSALRALAAHEPILVAIDDVQWLDAQSADALAFAARRLSGEPVRFLLSRRSPAGSTLEDALEPAPLARLEIGPLSVGATRRLLSERLGLAVSRRVLRRVVGSVDGNPFFALEVARTLAERGAGDLDDEIPVPDAIEGLLGTRVGGLPSCLRRLLLAVALSPELGIAQLGEIADAQALDEAIAAGLVVVEGERVRAAHPLIAAAVRTHSQADERRGLHRELARAVADEGLRAHHLALAAERPDGELAGVVAAAAARAAARGAAEHAVELAEHALRLTPPGAAERGDRVLALAEHLLVAGEHERAAEVLTPEADRLPTGPARGRAHLLLADACFRVLHVDESADHLERALAESKTDATLRATVMARRSRFSAVARVERLREAEAWAEEALPAARAAGAAVEREVLHGLAWARTLRGRPIDDLCERFEAVVDDGFPLFRSLDRIAAERLALRGHLHEARALLARLQETAEERGEGWSHATLRLQLIEVELRAGEWETASQLLDEWNRSPDRELLGPAAAERCRALLAAGRGHAAASERWAAEAIVKSEANGLRWNLLEGLRARGIAALLSHRPDAAADSLRVVWEHTEREGVDEPAMFPAAPDLVEALVEIGGLDEARAVTNRLLGLAVEQDHPWGRATAQRCRALVRLAAGCDYEQAAGDLARAAADYAKLGLGFDRARSLLALGRGARRLKKWAAARGSLEQAVAAFAELGSPGWAEEARSELGRVGARKRSAAGKLTPTEERVVGLAASGRSNKEIAQSLFVTVHTVEVHLSRAYAKLGIRSRTQLAGRLAARLA